MKRLWSLFFLVTMSFGAVSLGEQRFGIDGAEGNTRALETLSALSDGWGGINTLPWLGPDHAFNAIWLARADRLVNELRANGRNPQIDIMIQPSQVMPWQNCYWLEFDLAKGLNHVYADGVTRGPLIKRIKPAYVAKFREFVRFIANRYHGSSRDGRTLILQMESEAENVWGSADGYAAYVNEGYLAAKAIDPNIEIWVGGFNAGDFFSLPQAEQDRRLLLAAVLGTTTTGLNDLGFMKHKYDFWVRFFQLRPRFDALALHLNHKASDIAPAVQWFRNQIDVNGMLGRAIVSEDTATKLDEHVRLSEEDFRREQAKLLVKKATLAFASGVRQVFLSTGYDWPGYAIARWNNAGLVSADGGKKHYAYYAFDDLVKTLDGFSSAQSVPALGAVAKLRFVKGGKSIWVIWSEEGERNVTLTNLAVPRVQVKSAVPDFSVGDGNTCGSCFHPTETKPVANGVVEIRASSMPVYVIEQ